MKKKKNYLDLRETQMALLGIMTEFDRICAEHGLRYSIAYGTLLGAVRHKGFIPWDDDVDFVMPRPDYEKLYALVRSGAIDLKDRFELSEDRGKHAFYSFCKLMDKRYRVKSWSHREVPYLFVDIFPLDGAPSGKKALKKLYRKRLFYSAVMALSRWAVPEKHWTVILRGIGFPFYLAATLYGMSRAARKGNAVAAANDYNACEMCSTFSFGTEKWLMPRDAFKDTERIAFEGKEFCAITAWDEWLVKLYGDYMTPPPAGKRISHSLRVRDTEGENGCKSKNS